MNFSFRRFYAIFMARNKEFYRDLGALGWVFVFPFLMLISFNYIFEMDPEEVLKVAVVEGSKPIESPLFMQLPMADVETAMNKLKRHKVDLLVQQDGDGFKLWYNESSVPSTTALAVAKGALSQPAVPLQVSKVTGEEITYAEWLFPGLLAMNVLWMALWGVGWVIVRHRKLGVLKRYKASPVTPVEYLLGQMLSRLVVLIFTGVVVFVGAYLIHPFPIKGSLADLVIIYTLGCICHASIGMIIAARMTSEELANGVLNLITYPAMFVSEVWFSLEGSDEWVLQLAHLTPLWHMTDGMRRILFDGVGLLQLGPSLALFLGVSILGLALGSILFRWVPDGR